MVYSLKGLFRVQCSGLRNQVGRERGSTSGIGPVVQQQHSTLCSTNNIRSPVSSKYAQFSKASFSVPCKITASFDVVFWPTFWRKLFISIFIIKDLWMLLQKSPL